MRGKVIRIALILAVSLAAGCCFLKSMRKPQIRPPDRPPTVHTLEVTAYCPCGKCCGWKRDWLGRPVFASGRLKGQRKEVGVTASGTNAQHGTIAADTEIFPFGTIMYVPGYGYGRVEDRGGAIKGNKIDLFYRSHQDALEWGRQHKRVKVWLPR